MDHKVGTKLFTDARERRYISFLTDFFRYVRLCLVAIVVNHFGLKFKLATKGKEKAKKLKGATAGGVSFIFC